MAYSTILTKTEHLTIADAGTWLSNLKTAMVAAGWTLNWEKNHYKYTSTGSTWVASTGDHAMCLTSAGSATTSSYIYQFELASGKLKMNLCSSTSDVGSGYSSPAYRYKVMRSAYTKDHWYLDYSYHFGMSLTGSNFTKQWIFANAYFVACITSMDGTYYQHVWFGEIDNLDTTLTGQNGGWQCYQFIDDADWTGYASGAKPSSPYFPDTVATDGGTRKYTGVECSYESGAVVGQKPDAAANFEALWGVTFQHDDLTTNNRSSVMGQYEGAPFYIRMDGINSFSNIRPMYRQLLWYTKGSGYGFVPAGYAPFWLLYVSGLTPGQAITYGGETYYVFPWYRAEHNYGVAFRTA